MPPQLEISGDVPTVAHIRVRGRSALLRRMVPADLNLRLDFKDQKEGMSAVRITSDMVGAPFGATVVEVSPPEIRVTFVPRRVQAPPIS